MYTKDKMNRITLRLNDAQFNHVKDNADMLGVSPSEFLRMVINSSMALAKKQVTHTISYEGGLAGRANDEADINN